MFHHIYLHKLVHQHSSNNIMGKKKSCNSGSTTNGSSSTATGGKTTSSEDRVISGTTPTTPSMPTTSTTMTMMTTTPSSMQDLTKTFESVDTLKPLICKNVRMQVEESPNQTFWIVTGLLNKIRSEDPFHMLHLAPALLDQELLKAITINLVDTRMIREQPLPPARTKKTPLRRINSY